MKPKKYILEDMHFDCPSCGKHNFTSILNYGVAPEKYQKIGKPYWFMVQCIDCGAEITYYCNVGPQRKK